MKPLKIDELKALQVGDWVWVVVLEKDFDFEMKTGYYQKISEFNFFDYGTKWIAYKNKEQAEAKGETVELPCKIGDDVYYVVAKGKNSEIVKTVVTHIGLYNHGIDIEAYQTNRHRFYNLDGQVIIDGLLLDKSEAERRLAELRGEK